MAADGIPERVRRVLADSGLSQARFAETVGLDGPKLSKSLQGTRRFTSLDLARIAEAGGVTVDHLLGIEPAVAASAARAATTSSAKRAVAQARDWARMRADLAFIGYQQGAVDGPCLDTDPRSRVTKQGTDLAHWATIRAAEEGFEASKSRDLAKLIEAVFRIDVGLVDLPDGFDGLSWSGPDAKLIVVATSQVPARQRFSIAHELGHLLAADDQGVHVDTDIYADVHRRDPSEIRANAFAAAFLLPEQVVREAVGDTAQVAGLTEREFAEHACRWSVSPSTLAWRLYNLDLIGAESCAKFRRLNAAQVAERCGKMADFGAWIAAASKPGVPDALLDTTYRAYLDGETTLRPYANLLGVDTDTLREALAETPEESPLTP